MAHIQNWMKVLQTGGNLCIFNRMPACISGAKLSNWMRLCMNGGYDFGEDLETDI